MRSDSINLALLVHVAGAMVLVGGLVTAAADGDHRLARRGGRRCAASRTGRSSPSRSPATSSCGSGRSGSESKEHLDNLPDDPTWLGIGYITADGGALLLLIALILGGIGMRRQRSGGGGGLLKASSVIATVLVAVYVVTIWAMGAKPT